MHAQAVNIVLPEQNHWAVHTRHSIGQRAEGIGSKAEGIGNRAEDSAHTVWQQHSHLDSKYTSGPESDDLALDVAAAP